VIDFIEFHIKEVFHWPTFNIADSAITVGIVLLLIDAIRNPALEEAKLPAAGGGQ
jgi:signal peptidase II